jgi:hypothetical protein
MTTRLHLDPPQWIDPWWVVPICASTTWHTSRHRGGWAVCTKAPVGVLLLGPGGPRAQQLDGSPLDMAAVRALPGASEMLASLAGAGARRVVGAR